MSQRPLLDRLHDMEHFLRLHGYHKESAEIVEARERIQYLEGVLKEVDVEPVSDIMGR